MNRMGFIGGSDVAAIMGLSPWQTDVDVYLSKIGEAKNITEDQYKIFSRGHRAEKYVLETYSDETGNVLVDSKQKHVIDAQEPYLQGNVDAWVKDSNVIVEAKSTSDMSKWDEVPIYYKTQIAFYRMLTNADRVDLAVLFPRWVFGLYHYHCDLEFEASIREACKNFWENHVLKVIPPEAKNLDDVKSLYAESIKSTITASEEILEEYKKFVVTQQAIKRLTDAEEEAKLKIQKFMGVNDSLVNQDGHQLINWSSRKVNKFSGVAMRKEHPDLYEKYKQETSVRAFRLKGEK